jgi:hypothetical protein
MIQRIQSLFLLLTTIMSIIFLKGPFLTFIVSSGSAIKITLSGILNYADSANPVRIGDCLAIVILAIIIPVLSTTIIFLFRRRDIQLLFAKILIFLITAILAALVLCSYSVISKYNAQFTGWYKLIIPLFELILVIFAFRGIKRDDDLVKSYERLR